MLKLQNVFVYLYDFLDKLAPFSVKLTLAHILCVIVGELNNSGDLTILFDDLCLRSDFLDEPAESIISVLDLLEHLMIDKELHIALEAFHSRIIVELDVVAGTLGLGILENLIGLLLAFFLLLIEPLQHLLELILTQRNVHVLAVHGVHIVDKLFQVGCLDADHLGLALLVIREYISIKRIKHENFLDEVAEELSNSLFIDLVELSVFIEIVCVLR